ncbi:glutathione peroxidase 3 [Pelobates cultripes]|uniref:Glutathione peroxidase 3 n=2 Tax=Pelobates TaxID=61615 RepID=A0AAD1RSW6_PELCU|nr:glutathione peroxidase 3 [Pelobates cultripes]
MGVKSRMLWLLPCFLAAFVKAQKEIDQKWVDCDRSVTGSVYEYGALSLEGSQYIPFSKYQGKMILFVNVATY